MNENEQNISERSKKLLDEVKARRNKPYGVQLGERMAQWIIYTVAIVTLGTPLGLWVKFFWLDYILQVCR